MSNRELSKALVRFENARRLLAIRYNSQGDIKSNPDTEYEAIQAWIWIPSLYSLIEQGLKLIVASYRKEYDKTHILMTVYKKLNPIHQNLLASAYNDYVAFYDRIPQKTLEKFLSNIDGKTVKERKSKAKTRRKKKKMSPTGYAAWRYILLEGLCAKQSRPPKVSIEAMFEIAKSIVHVLNTELGLNDHSQEHMRTEHQSYLSKQKLSKASMRIDTARQVLARSYSYHGGVKPDQASAYEAIQAWMWVPSLYSLIEQGLKLIVLSCKQELDRIHKLTEIYESLSPKYQELLANSYRKYVAVHSYIPYNNLRDFLIHMDGGCIVKKKVTNLVKSLRTILPTPWYTELSARILGTVSKEASVEKKFSAKRSRKGYTAWRYILLEGFSAEDPRPPRINIGLMFELARAVFHVLQTEIDSNNHSIKYLGIEHRLYSRLSVRMSELVRPHLQNNDIQRGVIEQRQDLAIHFHKKFEDLHEVLTENVNYVIEFLRGSSVLTENPTSELECLCQFMMEYDRKGFLNLAEKVRLGHSFFPRSSIQTCDDGTSSRILLKCLGDQSIEEE